MEELRTSVPWAAGVFDAKGTAWAQHKRDRTYLQLQLADTDRELLERFQGLFGGRIAERSAQGNDAAIKVWRLENAEQAKEVVSKMWPYLGKVRKSQVQAVLVQVEANPPDRRLGARPKPTDEATLRRILKDPGSQVRIEELLAEIRDSQDVVEQQS